MTKIITTIIVSLAFIPSLSSADTEEEGPISLRPLTAADIYWEKEFESVLSPKKEKEDESVSSPEKDEPVLSPEKEQRRVTPKTWTMLGLTGAAFVGFGITEGVGYTKSRSYRSKTYRTVGERNKVTAWSKANCGVFSFAIAAATATIVLLLSDLSLPNPNSESSLSLLPATDGSKPLLILHGKF